MPIRVKRGQIEKICKALYTTNVIVKNIHWALSEDAEMSYRLSYLENFHFSNLLAASEAGC